MYRAAIAIFLLGTSAAFAGTKDNHLSVSYKDGGFKGKAGINWSDEDLRSNAFGSLCPKGYKVADLQIQRNSKGVSKFTGKCVK